MPGPCCVVPLGATEQHGPHLPLETDTVIARRARRRPRPRRRDVSWRRRPLPYGSSGEHARLPGHAVARRRRRSSCGRRRARPQRAPGLRGRGPAASWHGGNAEPLARAVRLLRARAAASRAGSRRSRAATRTPGRVETSLHARHRPGARRRRTDRVGATDAARRAPAPRCASRACGPSRRAACSGTPAGAAHGRAGAAARPQRRLHRRRRRRTIDLLPGMKARRTPRVAAR